MRIRRSSIAAVVLAALPPAVSAQKDAGLELFIRPDKGYCIACHQVPASAGPQTRSDVGPALEGTRMRAIGREGLRALLRDPQRANPDTVMPPFGKHHILDEREIDHVTEYLLALP